MKKETSGEGSSQKTMDREMAITSAGQVKGYITGANARGLEGSTKGGGGQKNSAGEGGNLLEKRTRLWGKRSVLDFRKGERGAGGGRT